MRSAAGSSQQRGGRSRGREQEHSDPVCSICRSEEFYEDDQGGMICVACGTQSQDFLAEGFDEDDLAVYGGGTGNMVTQRNEARGPKSLDQSKKDSKVDLIPDTLEALKLYQYVLQMLADACWSHSQLDESEEGLNAFRNTLKGLWMDYLTAWQSSTASAAPTAEPSSSSSKGSFMPRRCSIGMAFSRSATCRCRCKHIGTSQGHPLRPSKPLLLGFVYLALRIMRSSVLVSDFVRWIECGSVPYASVWEAIPAKQRESVSVEIGWFYDHPVGRKRPLISTESILFHACSLAQSLRPQVNDSSRLCTSLTPLNAPLIAQKMVSALGLPTSVWEMYTSIAQLFSACAPIIGADTVDQHHEEFIMAVLIVAVKFCPRWTTWDTLRDVHTGADSSSTSIITGSQRVDGEVPRSQLPAVLAQIRRTHRLHTAMADTARLSYRLNNSVYAALGGDPDALKKHVSDGTALTPHHQQHHGGSRLSVGGARSAAKPALRSVFRDAPRFVDHVSYAYSLHSHPVVLHGESLLAEELSLKDRRNLAYLNGVEPTISERKGTSGEKSTDYGDATRTAAYMANTRYSRDETGLHHVPYLTLLERCAKYLYTNPQLLHELVCKLETQIVNLAFTGQHTNEGTLGGNEITNTTQIRLGDIKSRGKKRSAQLRDVGRYQAESDKVLPKLRRRGLRTLAMRAQLRQRGAPHVGASEPSGDDSNSEDSKGSAGEENDDAAASAMVPIPVSDANLKPLDSVTEKTWSLPPFRFSKAASFWDVECAFGTDKGAQRQPRAGRAREKAPKRTKPNGKASGESEEKTRAHGMDTGDDGAGQESAVGSEKEEGVDAGSGSDSPMLQSGYDTSGGSEWERAMYGPTGLVPRPSAAARTTPVSVPARGGASKPQQPRQIPARKASTPSLMYDDGESEDSQQDDDSVAERTAGTAPPRPLPVASAPLSPPPQALSLRSLIGLSGTPVASSAPAASSVPPSAVRAAPVPLQLSVSPLPLTSASQTPSLRALIGLTSTPARSTAPAVAPSTLHTASSARASAAPMTAGSSLPRTSPPKALSLRDLIGLPPAPAMRTSPQSVAAAPVASSLIATAATSMPVSEPESVASLSSDDGSEESEDDEDWGLSKRKAQDSTALGEGGDARPVVAMKRLRAAAYSNKPE